MTKLERINQEIQKTQERIAEFQSKLKTLSSEKTEQENLQIVQLVRSINMTPQQLMEFLKKAAQTSPVIGKAAAPATIVKPQEIKEEKKDVTENK